MPLQASSNRHTIVGIKKQESSLRCKAISVEKSKPNSVKLQNRLARGDLNLVFNKYCKEHYFLNIIHLRKMGMTAVTVAFSLLDVDFYCPIDWRWETEIKHLLACKIELSKERTVLKDINRDEIQKGTS